MKLAKSVMLWTPDTDSYDGKPNRGQVVVAAFPEAADIIEPPEAAGACMPVWHVIDDFERRKLLVNFVRRMIERDNIKEETVRAALSEIEDIDPDVVIATSVARPHT